MSVEMTEMTPTMSAAEEEEEERLEEPMAAAEAKNTTVDESALQPLEDEIDHLGMQRHHLEELKRHKDRHGLNMKYFKRGTAKHHRNKAKFLRDSNSLHHGFSNIRYHLADTHTAIADSMGRVKAAHGALMASRQDLAKQVGPPFKRTRIYKTHSGAWQSLGHYDGKDKTDVGLPKTFEKGGRKTRKHRRKHKRKTRKRKRKRKTKKRKHHRRKYKRKTRRR